jgi:hypothetical protein
VLRHMHAGGTLSVLQYNCRFCSTGYQSWGVCTQATRAHVQPAADLAAARRMHSLYIVQR